MSAGPVRIVIVDDHPVVRDGLRGMLTGDGGLAVVGEADRVMRRCGRWPPSAPTLS